MAKYISDILKELRARLGWSIRELERRSGVSNASISRIESGLSEPKAETLIALANALGVESRILLEAPIKHAKTIDIQDALRCKFKALLLRSPKFMFGILM